MKFTNEPAKIEVLDKAEKIVNVNTLDGTILVGEDTSTATKAWFKHTEIDVSDNYPNPFKEKTNISIVAAKAQRAELVLWTKEGKQIKTYTLQLLSGEIILK
ncbi:MAG: hypothetical protein HC912_01485 [Saprospiraceae bacterium]|nr:hypothetical protein [Saprospiraceae bacterium]